MSEYTPEHARLFLPAVRRLIDHYTGELPLAPGLDTCPLCEADDAVWERGIYPVACAYCPWKVYTGENCRTYANAEFDALPNELRKGERVREDDDQNRRVLALWREKRLQQLRDWEQRLMAAAGVASASDNP